MRRILAQEQEIALLLTGAKEEDRSDDTHDHTVTTHEFYTADTRITRKKEKYLSVNVMWINFSACLRMINSHMKLTANPQAKNNTTSGALAYS